MSTLESLLQGYHDTVADAASVCAVYIGPNYDEIMDVQVNALLIGPTQCDQIGRFIGLWVTF